MSVAPSDQAIKEVLKKGVDFLRKSQLPHGEFATLASEREDLTGAIYDQSAFPTTLIAYSISFLDCPAVNNILQKSLNFLLREMHAPGFWSYWGSSSARQLPIDTDTTSNALVVLKKCGVPVQENRERLLANRDEQGLFYTWLLDESLNSVGGRFVPASDYENVHPVINANVLAFLGHSETTDRAIRWILSWFDSRNKDWRFPWYTDRLCLHYAVSRAFHNGLAFFSEARTGIVLDISSRLSCGESLNPLQQAQAACCLRNFSVDSEPLPHLLRSIVAQQREDGSWPAAAMYDGAGCYYGSEEMTTAFCLEALSRGSSPR